MKNKLSIIIFVLFLMLSFGSVEQVLACSCSSVESLCETFGEAKAVFIGEVISAKEVTLDKGTYTESAKKFEFKIKESFVDTKLGEKISVHTGFGSGDCGFPFQVGESYLVFAYGDDTFLSTGICVPTRHISTARETLEFLRKNQEKETGAIIKGKVIIYSSSQKERDSTKPIKNQKLQFERIDKSH